jgi:hypothetical protein
MKSYVFHGAGGSRAQAPLNLTARRAKRDDVSNQTDYTVRRIRDTPAIEAHIRCCKLSLSRIAQMYGFPLEFIEQIEKDIWAKDWVYRLNRALTFKP